jgi:hypothetical protein
MDRYTLWSTIAAAFVPLDDAADEALMRCVAELGLQTPWFPWLAAAAMFGPERVHHGRIHANVLLRSSRPERGALRRGRLRQTTDVSR